MKQEYECQDADEEGDGQEQRNTQELSDEHQAEKNRSQDDEVLGVDQNAGLGAVRI